MFTFFLQSHRTGILTFGGSKTEVKFDLDGDEGKYCFRKVENGEIKRNSTIVTRHPNIVRSVVQGKKSWGLWVNEWSKGISEGSFTKKEILKEFEDKGIEIPSSLFIDFENRIIKFTLDRVKKTIG